MDRWWAASRTAIPALVLAAACQVRSDLPQDVDPARYEAISDPAVRLTRERAVALLDADRDAEAVPLLREVLARAPEHVPTHVLYQDTCRVLGGDALAEMEAWYLGFPGDPPPSVVRYMRARLMEYDADRLVALNELLATDPGFYYAHLSRARLLRSVGQPDRAVQSFDNALEVNPDLLEARLELAEVLVELRRPREAEPQYAAYVRGNPTDQEARRDYLRLLLYELGRVEDARDHVLALQREMDPDDLTLLMDRAAVAWQSNQLEEAEAFYLRVLSLDRNQAVALLNLGNLYFEAMAPDDDSKRRYWPMAREKYLEYRTLGRPEGAMDLFDFHFAIPYRLEEIDKFLGPDGRQ